MQFILNSNSSPTNREGEGSETTENYASEYLCSHLFLFILQLVCYSQKSTSNVKVLKLNTVSFINGRKTLSVIERFIIFRSSSMFALGKIYQIISNLTCAFISYDFLQLNKGSNLGE